MLTFYAKEGQELIHGSRRFMISPGGYLMGGAGVVWPSAEMKAICLMEPNANVGKHILSGQCSCGINISKGDQPANGGGPVYAEMIGWGKFFEGQYGWHCEYGEIVAIKIDDPRYNDMKPVLENHYPEVEVSIVSVPVVEFKS